MSLINNLLSSFSLAFSSFRIDDISSSGIFLHLERLHLPLSDLKSICAFTDDKVLVLGDLISTFVLIVAGFGMSTVALTFEVLFPKCCKLNVGNDEDSLWMKRTEKGDYNRDHIKAKVIKINGKTSFLRVKPAAVDQTNKWRY